MNYNIGPKLGDFIHGLVIPKFIYETTGKKAHIFLSDKGCTFSTSVQQVYDEMIHILLKQDYVEKFTIYNNEKTDYDICHFRQSPRLFRDSWTNLYSSLINRKIPDSYQWLSYSSRSAEDIVVNRSIREMSPSTYNWWESLLKGKEAQFIYTDKKQYDHFPLKHMVNPFFCPTIEDMVDKISSCSLFIGNQSAPLAIASALNKQRIAELRRNPDAIHYQNEKNPLLITFIGD